MVMALSQFQHSFVYYCELTIPVIVNCLVFEVWILLFRVYRASQPDKSGEQKNKIKQYTTKGGADL